ncbi:MAG: NAD(P)H-hydrate dehydratase [Bacteroidia bacterium]|nr:NAD(P)H-hydrate dehydratase [Bacteroidia bacterium]
MKILTKTQIQDWDKFTITHEPVSSLGLMERAAARCYNLLIQHLTSKIENLPNKVIQVFCGQGNNGGDGLVIARFLKNSGYKVDVYILKQKDKGTDDFEINLIRYNALEKEAIIITNVEEIGQIKLGDIVIDALYGTGLNAPLQGLSLLIINCLNAHNALKLAVDIPSGCFADVQTALNYPNAISFRADITYTFQVPKSSFLFPETGVNIGSLFVIDIDLHSNYLEQIDSNFIWMNKKQLTKPQNNKFTYKWSKGHVLIIGGTEGKMGAVILASKAALRGGSGLVTAYIPKDANQILQTAIPEVMVLLDSEQSEIRNFPNIDRFQAVAIGPGLGTHTGTIHSFFSWFMNIQKPVILDADALNICAVLMNSKTNFKFPIGSILTPHAKEFDRLFGQHDNSYLRLQTAITKAKQFQIVIVLKGAYTQIVSPNGDVYFNNSGNNLLATAGSGDVLTGIISSILAQGSSPLEAAKYGVHLHGLLANSLLNKGYKYCIASDLIEELKFVQ